jgi:exopolysaccharide production protein ExoZ
VTIESPDRGVISIQMLRAIAATMVVFVHMDVQLQRLHYSTLGTNWMASGVDVFFVISGFIMWTSVERRPGMTATAFFRNRLIRIVPLYWFATTLLLLVAVVAPQVLNTTVLRPWHAVASYLFIPVRHPTKGIFWPLLIPGWSLNYEMMFYAIFAIAIALGGQARIVRFLLIAGLLGGILVFAGLTQGEFDIMSFYANPILLEFLAGVGLAIWWRTSRVRRSWLWLAIVALGFVCLWAGAARGGGFLLTALGSTIIVAGAIFLPPLPHNPLSTLGDASYSLYLTHVMSLSAVALIWHHLFLGLDWRLFIFTGLAASIVGALITYRAFEVPVTAALKRHYSRRSGVAGRPAPVSGIAVP